jgi:uncharacterized membrane protein YeiH
VLYLLQLLATVICACSGALTAGRKNLDLIGLLAISFATAVGGGTLRDLLLDRNPVFWMGDTAYVFASIAAALAIWIYTRFWAPPERFLLIVDSFGLGLFLICGIQIAEHSGQSATVALLMGVITGVAGGVIRDVLCGEIPLIFRRSELYASAALAGGTAYFALRRTGVPESASALASAAITIFLRLAALRWRWHLPVLAFKENSQSG